MTTVVTTPTITLNMIKQAHCQANTLEAKINSLPGHCAQLQHERAAAEQSGASAQSLNLFDIKIDRVNRICENWKRKRPLVLSDEDTSFLQKLRTSKSKSSDGGTGSGESLRPRERSPYINFANASRAAIIAEYQSTYGTVPVFTQIGKLLGAAGVTLGVATAGTVFGGRL